jgi:hypothetical protein
MTQHTVFISHAANDKSRIKKVIGELRSKGIVQSDDEIVDHSNILPGADWRNEVHKAIEGASKVVVVWPAGSAESPRAYYESAMAEALDKPIIVVVAKGQRSLVPDQLNENTVLELDSVTA